MTLYIIGIASAYTTYIFLVVVQSFSCVWLFAAPNIAAQQVPLSTAISQSLLKFMSVESAPNHFIVSFCLQSLPALGSFPMSWLFASGDHSIGASASVLPMNIQGWFPLENGNWFDLCAVQGTLKSLLQHHKASILWHSVFFMGQFSHPLMTTGKTIALTIQIFVS